MSWCWGFRLRLPRADICHHRDHWRWYTFFKPVPFSAQRTRNLGLFWPIWAFLLRISLVHFYWAVYQVCLCQGARLKTEGWTKTQNLYYVFVWLWSSRLFVVLHFTFLFQLLPPTELCACQVQSSSWSLIESAIQPSPMTLITISSKIICLICFTVGSSVAHLNSQILIFKYPEFQ